jgi:hypothetical protein
VKVDVTGRNFFYCGICAGSRIPYVLLCRITIFETQFAMLYRGCLATNLFRVSSVARILKPPVGKRANPIFYIERTRDFTAVVETFVCFEQAR